MRVRISENSLKLELTVRLIHMYTEYRVIFAFFTRKQFHLSSHKHSAVFKCNIKNSHSLKFAR